MDFLEMIDRCKKAYALKFGSLDDFMKEWDKYINKESFKANENIGETDWNDKTHFIMRYVTGFYIEQAFRAMKIDLEDDNIKEDLENGNIGTPQRIAKTWVGGHLNDDMELGSGRWAKKPRLARFPNTAEKNVPITKRVDIISNCSHHFITFSSLARPDSYVIISYIPDKFVLGISKLQRVANWVAQRFFLQEDLTKMLYDEISSVAETESVYIYMKNIVHGCESFRGARSDDGAFTSEYYGGAFDDINLRRSVIS